MRAKDKSLIRGAIDRFEGDLAIFISEDDDLRLEIPMALLPEDSSEGSIVEIKIKVKKNKEKEAKEKVKKLIEELKTKKSA